MFCRHCGAEISGNPARCPNCGGDITPLGAHPGTPSNDYRYPGTPAQDLHYPGEAAPDFRYPETPAEEYPPQPPKRKRWPLFAALAAGILVILAVVIVLVATHTGKSGTEPEASIINARISDDGTACIPLMDGTWVTIPGDVDSASITRDRKQVVVLLTDGTLYVTDPQLSEKTTIADDAESFYSLRDDGFFFKDRDLNVYRVLFRDCDPLELGNDVAAAVADNTTSVLFATDDGNIYTLACSSDERNKVGYFEKNVTVEGISDDGQISIWVDNADTQHTICLHDGEDRFTLGTVDSKYNYTYVTFTTDQQMVTVVNTYCENMWILNRGEDPVTVKLGAEPSLSTVYSPKGRLSRSTAEQATSLYLLTDAETGSNVYCVSPDGERERVLSRVLSMSIAGDYIVYLDSDNALRCGKLNGASLTEEAKLAGDVDIFEVSLDGQYVYYMKGVSEDTDTGSLYCIKLGTDSPEKIDSDVSCFYYSASLSFMHIDISADGKTVFYCADPEKIGDTYTKQGTLMMWTYGGEDPVRIASDVIAHTPISGYVADAINPSAMAFLKVSYFNSDDDIFANWMFYNGKESQRMASDVKY